MTCKTTLPWCKGKTSPAHPDARCADQTGVWHLPWCLGAGWYL
jgi:hypothetical protein